MPLTLVTQSNTAFTDLEELAGTVGNLKISNNLNVGGKLLTVKNNGLVTLTFNVTVLAGAANGQSTNAVPAGFYPLLARVQHGAITNARTFDDLGIQGGDTDGFVNDATLVGTAALMQAGTPFVLPCNGALGLATAVAGVARGNLMVTLSGTPGVNTNFTITLLGVLDIC